MEEVHRPNRVFPIALGVFLGGFAVVGVWLITEGEGMGWLFALAGGLGAGVLLYQGLFRNKTLVLTEAELRWGSQSWPYAEVSVGEPFERHVKGFPVTEFKIFAPGEEIDINSNIYTRWQDLYTELVKRC